MQYFGSWKHLVPFVALILVLLWSWGELGLSDPGLDLPDTCMSDQSSQAIQDLTAAVQALTLAISGQASSPPSETRSEASAGDWEVVGSDPQDIRISGDFECSRVSHRGAEEGPGEIPPILLDIAKSKLSSKPPGAEFRALRAFRAGFWARIAVDTHTPYTQADPVPECRVRYWIVLSCPAFSGAAWFNTRSDFGRAIEGDIRNSVFESFASQTEIEIFCAGASAPLPALRTWRSQASSSSRRGTQASSSGPRH